MSLIERVHVHPAQAEADLAGDRGRAGRRGVDLQPLRRHPRRHPGDLRLHRLDARRRRRLRRHAIACRSRPALVQMVVGYLLSLAIVYVLALIVNALAPTFGGSKDLVAALKVVAYGSTAGFLGGVFSLLPSLALLGLLAAFYSIYLIYTGLPVLMRCPPEKAGAYTAVVVVCAIIAMIVLGAVSSLFVSRGPMGFGTATRRRRGAARRRRRRRHPDQDARRRDGDHQPVEPWPTWPSAWRKRASGWSRRSSRATAPPPARRWATSSAPSPAAATQRRSRPPT